MKPFNVNISIKQNEVVLTILPIADNEYKVIYYGGILGAIRYEISLKEWQKIPDEDVVISDLPPYQYGLKEDRIEFTLDEQNVNSIGQQIEMHLATI